MTASFLCQVTNRYTNEVYFETIIDRTVHNYMAELEARAIAAQEFARLMHYKPALAKQMKDIDWYVDSVKV